jgi:hypothetical protein
LERGGGYFGEQFVQIEGVVVGAEHRDDHLRGVLGGFGGGIFPEPGEAGGGDALAMVGYPSTVGPIMSGCKLLGYMPKPIGNGATNADSLWLLRRHQAYRDTPVSTWNSWLDSAAADARPRWCIAFSHQCIASPGFYDVTPAMLNTHLGYLYNTYGAGGADNVWVAPSEEVLHYLYARRYTVLTRQGAPLTPSSTPTWSPPSSHLSALACVCKSFNASCFFLTTARSNSALVCLNCWITCLGSASARHTVATPTPALAATLSTA